MSEDSGGLKMGTLKETMSWMGREFAMEGVDEVTGPGIRKKVEVFGFDCPLYYDEATARAHGYRTIVSPLSALRVWAMPAYWRPGDPEPQPGEPVKHGTLPSTEIPAPGKEVINAGSRWEFLGPVYAGDRIRVVAKLVKVEPKRTRLGEGVFLTMEMTYRNQADEVIAIEHNTVFRYDKVEE